MLRTLKIALVAGSLLVAGTALADRGGDGKRGDGFDRRAKRMAKFDLDKNGKLDPAERAAMTKAKFARLDKNKDGVLSLEEAQPILDRSHGKKRGERRGAHGRADRAE